MMRKKYLQFGLVLAFGLVFFLLAPAKVRALDCVGTVKCLNQSELGACQPDWGWYTKAGCGYVTSGSGEPSCQVKEDCLNPNCNMGSHCYKGTANPPLETCTPGACVNGAAACFYGDDGVCYKDGWNGCNPCINGCPDANGCVGTTPRPTGPPPEYSTVNCDSLAISGGSTTLIKGQTYTFTSYYYAPLNNPTTEFSVRKDYCQGVSADPPYPLNDPAYYSASHPSKKNGHDSFDWTPGETGTYQVYCGASVFAMYECQGTCIDHPTSYYGSLCTGSGAYKTVTVVPPTPPTCNVQGYKVLMPGNQKTNYPPAGDPTDLTDSQPVSNGVTSLTGNPYYHSQTSSQTYSVPPLSGYDIGYTLCYNRTDCHVVPPATITQANSVSVDQAACLLNSGPPYPYADLYWHYTRQTGTIQARAVTVDPLLTSCATIRAGGTGGLNGTVHQFTPSSASQPAAKTQSGSTYSRFTNLITGQYIIDPQAPAGYVPARYCWQRTTAPTTDETQSADLASGDTLTWDIGYTLGTAWAQAQGDDVYASATLKSFVPELASPRARSVL